MQGLASAAAASAAAGPASRSGTQRPLALHVLPAAHARRASQSLTHVLPEQYWPAGHALSDMHALSSQRPFTHTPRLQGFVPEQPIRLSGGAASRRMSGESGASSEEDPQPNSHPTHSTTIADHRGAGIDLFLSIAILDLAAGNQNTVLPHPTTTRPVTDRRFSSSDSDETTRTTDRTAVR
jgi:hypothetical protein